MFELIIDGLIYSYSNLEDETNLNFWNDYYQNNSSAVELYFKDDKDKQKITLIKESAQDTAQGFLHVLDVANNGNNESSYKCDKPDVIKGVAFITNTDQLIPENILMSVGVFTTKKASFYIMVGICIGFKYNGLKQRGLSDNLSIYVARIINSPRFTQDGAQKITFITRPLAKMGEIFHSGSTEDLHIKYDNDLLLPPKDDAQYNITKSAAIQSGIIRQQIALDWLKNCNLCDLDMVDLDLCQMSKCVGDICFFYHFVLDIFSPRWGYTGIRIQTFLKEKKIGGGKHKSKIHRRRTLKRFMQRRLKKNNTRKLKKEKSIFIYPPYKKNKKIMPRRYNLI